MTLYPRTEWPRPLPRPRSSTGRPRPRLRFAGRWLGRGYLLATVAIVGCATMGSEHGQPLVPTQYQTRTGPFTVFTGVPIAPDAPAIRSLQSLERDVRTTLRVQVDEAEAPVEVYVLRDREAFSHFLTFYYPELPPRRAFFIAQGPRRVVYTYHNERLDEDLRHEATHALLHVAVGDLPLWLDEGLAEYFEGPEGREGLNPEHLARLPDDLKAGWRPDLARLETVKSVREMSPRDYRESWAWVHFLLNEGGPGKAALLAFLNDERSAHGATVPLSERLGEKERGSGQRLLSHIERVRTAPVVARPSSADSTILLQNASVEPVPAPRTPPNRSLFGRFLGLFGLGGRS